MCGKGLNVMRMKLNRCAIPFVVMCATFLTGVVIVCEYSLAPIAVAFASSGETVLMRYAPLSVIVPFVSAAHLLNACWCRRMKDRPTFVGAGFSQIATLAIFGHVLAAYGTGYGNGLAGWANLILMVVFALGGITVAAGSAGCADPSGMGFEASCAGDTGGVLGLFACTGECRRWFATLRARFRETSVTFPTDTIIGLLTTDNAVPRLLDHSGNIPQLPVLVKFTLERLAGMGLEPRLVVP